MSTRRNGVITEYEIRGRLEQHYGGNNESRELVRNRRIDSYGEVGSIVYSLSGSPPKGYAIHIPGHRMVSLYDNRGRRFQILEDVHDVINVSEVDADTGRETEHCLSCGRTHRELPERLALDIRELDDGYVWVCEECDERVGAIDEIPDEVRA